MIENQKAQVKSVSSGSSSKKELEARAPPVFSEFFSFFFFDPRQVCV